MQWKRLFPNSTNRLSIRNSGILITCSKVVSLFIKLIDELSIEISSTSWQGLSGRNHWPFPAILCALIFFPIQNTNDVASHILCLAAKTWQIIAGKNRRISDKQVKKSFSIIYTIGVSHFQTQLTRIGHLLEAVQTENQPICAMTTILLFFFLMFFF